MWTMYVFRWWFQPDKHARLLGTSTQAKMGWILVDLPWPWLIPVAIDGYSLVYKVPSEYVKIAIEAMALIEIVDLPFLKMVIFQFAM